MPSRVLIVLGQAWEVLTEADRTLLTKILGSVKLTPASVQIMVRPTFAIQDIEALGSPRVIAFGATCVDAARKYEHVKVGPVSVIVADDLARLDDASKKSLWLALRQMFGI